MPKTITIGSLWRAAWIPVRLLRRQVRREEHVRLLAGLAALDWPGHHLPHRVCGSWVPVRTASPAHDPLERLWRLPAYRGSLG
ncbi:MAG: hypothetical protein WBQ18_01590 [Solirubrobacteraceae bacterium]